MTPIYYVFVAIAFLLTTNASADTINACAKQSNGKLRLVADLGQCRSNEAPISWESQGPQGPAGPQGPPGEATCAASSFQLVGFTSTTVTPDNGIFALTAECQNEFPSSRICTTVEVYRTVILPDLSGAGTADAWVAPVLAGQTIDVTGFGPGINAQNLNCNGFQGGVSFGLTVNTDGILELQTCTTPLSIACCAPAP